MVKSDYVEANITESIRKGLDLYISSAIDHDKSILPKALKLFDEIINHPLQHIFTNEPPEKWGIKITREIIKIKKTIYSNKINSEDEEVYDKLRNFMVAYLPMIWDELYHKRLDNNAPIVRIAVDRVLSIKLRLPLPQYEPQDIRIIPLGRIIRTIPRCRLYEYKQKSNQFGEFGMETDIKILHINNVFGHNLKIPLTSEVYYKGGWARLLLKLFLYHQGKINDKIHLIKTELPLGDCDIMTTNLEKGKKIMEIVGEEDLSGIELFHDLDYAFASRDITMNLALFTKEGLYYSPLAEEAIKTGVVFHLPADHGIYSRNYFTHLGHQFIQDRGFERQFKFIIDGKAEGFKMKKENLQLFMGRFALVGLGRFIQKPDAAEKMEKYYYLLQKTGQLEQFRYVFQVKLQRDFTNIFEFYESLHSLYPDFSIIRSSDDYFRAVWYSEKLRKWFRREFKRMSIIKTDFSWIEIDENEEEIVFGLQDFVSDPKTVSELREFIPCFIERCKKRFKYSS